MIRIRTIALRILLHSRFFSLRLIIAHNKKTVKIVILPKKQACGKDVGEGGVDAQKRKRLVQRSTASHQCDDGAQVGKVGPVRGEAAVRERQIRADLGKLSPFHG